MAALLFGRAGLVRITRPVSDFYAAGRLMPAFLNSLAIAGSVVAALGFVGASGAIDFDWSGASVVLVGVGFGLVLAGLVLAPRLRAYGGYSIPDFLAERFDAETMRPIAILGVILCSAPALAAVLLAFGLLGEAALNLPGWIGIVGGVLLIFMATLVGGMRSLSLSQLAYYMVMLLAGLMAGVTMLWQTGAVAGIDAVLIDEVLPTLPWKAFAQSSPVNTAALFFCLVTGIASLPYILMRSFTAPDAGDARLAYLGAPVFLLLLCAAAPALAALYEAASVAEDDPLSMISEAVLVVGAVAALLSAGAALALSIGNVLSYDLFFKSLQPEAPVSRQLFVARLCLIAVTLLAGAAAFTWPRETLVGTSAAFSLAASAFMPVLVLGLWWKRLSTDAAIVGMVAGLVVCLYYMIAPHTIPFFFYESSFFLSDATDAQAATYAALRHDYYLAVDGAAQAEILAKWEEVVRPAANWLGVHGVLAGLFAVPVGFVATILAGLLTDEPSQDAQRFVEALSPKRSA